MLTTLKGGPLAAVTVVVLAVLGAVTYLASTGTLTGADVLVVISTLLAAVTGVTAAHVTGQVVASASQSLPPAQQPVPAPLPGPAAGNITPGVSAMAQGGR